MVLSSTAVWYRAEKTTAYDGGMEGQGSEMNAQLVEVSTAITREGGAGYGRLSLLLLLMLAACAPLPPESDEAAEGEGLVTIEGAMLNTSLAQGEAVPTGNLPAQAGADTPDVPTEQIAQVATVSSRHIVRKPTASKPVAAKPATSRSRVSSRASSSAKVESKVRTRPASVTPSKKRVVTQTASSSTESAAVAATTRQVSRIRSDLEAEPAPRPFKKLETPTPPVGDENLAGNLVFQPPPYRAPRPLEFPPIKAKAVAPNKPTTRKPGRRLPVKTEQVRIGDSRIEMVKLRGGTFQMGSSDGDYDERPLHTVSLDPFNIGRYEVTQRQWMSVMGENPSHFNDCAACPVDSVSWSDIQQFLKKLNQLSDRRFRLPSEAEWEYACRAGDRDAYCGDSDETQVSWYLENSGGRSQPVGRLASNAYGLYDMSGNVYEWVEDC